MELIHDDFKTIFVAKTSVPHYQMRHTLKHLLHMNHHSDSFFTYLSSTIFLVDTKSPA